MPIKPENKKLYPKNWKAITHRIRQLAGDVCEQCGVPNRFRRCNDDGTWTDIVLTVAHLDHDPRNNCITNLKLLCQRCHLAYDHEHHMKNARETRRKKKAVGELFDK